jgi:hypothetical protein
VCICIVWVIMQGVCGNGGTCAWMVCINEWNVNRDGG